MNADTIVALADPSVKGRLEPLPTRPGRILLNKSGHFSKRKPSSELALTEQAGIAPLD